jgi:hypothetical protein
MSKREITIIPGEGAFDQDQMAAKRSGARTDNVVPRNHDSKPVNMHKLAAEAKRTGDWTEYNETMMRVAGSSSYERGDQNSNALRHNQSVTTVIGSSPEEVRIAQENDFAEHHDEIIGLCESLTEAIQTGRLRGQQPLRHLANRMQDLKIRGENMGGNPKAEAYEILQDWVNTVNMTGMEFLALKKGGRR